MIIPGLSEQPELLRVIADAVNINIVFLIFFISDVPKGRVMAKQKTTTHPVCAAATQKVAGRVTHSRRALFPSLCLGLLAKHTGTGQQTLFFSKRTPSNSGRSQLQTNVVQQWMSNLRYLVLYGNHHHRKRQR